MARELAKAGARIDGFAYCPHHPEAVLEAYRRECRRRKPAPGMILDLIRDYKADPRRTLMIGDTDTDRRAAEAAGIGFRLYQGGSLLHLVQTVVPVLATDASALR
jgi:D-glycero-D-manno-heptose 1,7-bisphosphate phosphatase